MNWHHQPNHFQTVSQNCNVQPVSFGHASNHMSYAGYNPDGYTAFSCFPPPNSFSANQQRKLDQEFVDKFLMNKKSVPKIKILNSLKISEARNYLLKIISMKKELEVAAHELGKAGDDFDIKWKDVVTKQNKINYCLTQFTDETIINLKKELNKRSRKRTRIKKKKIALKAAQKEQSLLRKQKHDLIDQVLAEKIKDVEDIKREEAVKRQADAVLHEVRKKKFEGKKMLNMLMSLSKLRELRSQQEISRGGYCSKQVAETFNKVIDQFKTLWTKQAHVYQLEETGLKLMLEDNYHPEVKQSKFQGNLLEWEQTLFGNISNDENYKYLTQAESNFDSFIQIRREWDQFIAKPCAVMSSSIPVGWVIPGEPQSDWKPFLKMKRRP